MPEKITLPTHEVLEAIEASSTKMDAAEKLGIGYPTLVRMAEENEVIAAALASVNPKLGRPFKPSPKPLIGVHVRLPEHEVLSAREYAKRNKLAFKDVVAAALAEYLVKHDEEFSQII